MWQANYKAWGEIESLRINEIEQNLRYQGQYFDEETELHYNTFRYYDPQIGRYITQDPIGLNGSFNLFVYAPNPVAWIDPLGLCNISTKVHEGAQGKHIPGHNNYTAGKSILNENPQSLLDSYHSGNVITSRVINDTKVKVDFGKPIGTHMDVSGVGTPTTWGIIHSGKNGAHIVPALPDAF